jgi:hypothetical protein
MFLAIKAPGSGGGSGMSGMSGMSTLSVPTLAFIFALILVGYSIWDLDQLSSLRRSLVAAVAGASSPALVGASAGAPGTKIGAQAVLDSGAGGRAADSPAGSGGAGRDGASGGSRSRLLSILESPGTVVGCRIAMGVTMALMLVLMI